MLSIPLCISSPLKIWSVLSGLSGHGWSEAILVAGIREGLEKLLEVGAPTIQLFNSASAAAAEDDLSHWLSYQCSGKQDARPPHLSPCLYVQCSLFSVHMRCTMHMVCQHIDVRAVTYCQIFFVRGWQSLSGQNRS